MTGNSSLEMALTPVNRELPLLLYVASEFHAWHSSVLGLVAVCWGISGSLSVLISRAKVLAEFLWVATEGLLS